MDHFSIKIDKKMKANLYKICRLCGIDSADMIPLLSSNKLNKADCDDDDDPIKVDTEPDMNYKIKELVGIMVNPQANDDDKKKTKEFIYISL